MADIVKLDETILGSAASEITFSGISQAYQHLEVHLFGRASAGTAITLSIRLNGDAGTNYDRQWLIGNGASASASEAFGTTEARVGLIPGAGVSGNVAGGIIVTIPDYSRTAWQKVGLTQNAHKSGIASSNLHTRIHAVFYRSTAAVTSVTFLLSSGNFDTNTRAALYGYKASALQTILGSAASEVTISSIPQTGKMLLVMLVGRGTAAATSINPWLRYNSDTGSNYDLQQVYGSSTTPSAAESLGVTYMSTGLVAAASAPASVAGAVVLDVFDYARTAWQKGFAGRNAGKRGTSAGDLYVVGNAGFWRNTAAITSLTFVPSSGNFDTNTLVDVYVI